MPFQRLQKTLHLWGIPIVVGAVIVAVELPAPYALSRWVDASLLLAAAAVMVAPIVWPSIVTIMAALPLFVFACMWRAWTLAFHADGLRAVSGPVAWLVIAWMWTLIILQAILRLGPERVPTARRHH